MGKSNNNRSEGLLDLFDMAMDESDEKEGLSPLFSTLEASEKRYLDPELINSGGMKTISRVFDAVTGRYIAMAKLHEGAPKETYDPFICEARLTGLLEHPNIISIHDMGIDEDQTPFFTMELKQGDDLRKIISQKHSGNLEYLEKYPLNSVLEIFLKVCDAIAYAHSKGVVHLDIKPGNIQVGEFGEVQVCDWGLGKIIGKQDSSSNVEMFNPDWLNSMTLTGEIKGTPGYMAPEQVKDGKEKNETTDIYALGCLLYTILTNSSPIDGGTDEILEVTTTGRMIPPAQRFPKLNVPHSLSAVVMKAVSLDQHERYDSVVALRKEVYNYLAGFATSAENASFLRGLTLLYKRNKLICNVTFILSLVIIIGSAQFIINLNKKTAEAIAAGQEADEARKKAESLLIENQNEQKRVAALGIQKDLIQKTIIQQIDYSKPIKSVADKVADFENRPPGDAQMNILSEYYYIQQRYREVYELNKDREKPYYLFKHAPKFIDVPRTKSGLLNIDDFFKSIRHFNLRQRDMLEKAMVWDTANRKNFQGYEKVVKLVLSGWNNGLKDSTFDYSPSTKSLSLSGADFKILGTEDMADNRNSLLAPLDLVSLDIRNTQIHDLSQLRGLNNLKELDVRHTLVPDLEPLNQLPAIEKVIVLPKQFSTRQIKVLKPSIQVLIQD